MHRTRRHHSPVTEVSAKGQVCDDPPARGQALRFPWSSAFGRAMMRQMPPVLAPLARRFRAHPRATLAASLCLAAGCSLFVPSQTKVVVSHTSAGDRAFREEGKSMSLNHWDLDQGAAGLKKGFFVVKTEFEWRSLWPQTEADKIPLLPQDRPQERDAPRVDAR